MDGFGPLERFAIEMGMHLQQVVTIIAAVGFGFWLRGTDFLEGWIKD